MWLPVPSMLVQGGPSVGPDTETAVNIEWGAFWSPRLPRCEVDEDVDRASKHPGGCVGKMWGAGGPRSEGAGIHGASRQRVHIVGCAGGCRQCPGVIRLAGCDGCIQLLLLLLQKFAS
jgi:hypothetical protein